jgi:hypothetical protein
MKSTKTGTLKLYKDIDQIIHVIKKLKFYKVFRLTIWDKINQQFFNSDRLRIKSEYIVNLTFSNTSTPQETRELKETLSYLAEYKYSLQVIYAEVKPGPKHKLKSKNTMLRELKRYIKKHKLK